MRRLLPLALVLAPASALAQAGLHELEPVAGTSILLVLVCLLLLVLIGAPLFIIIGGVTALCYALMTDEIARFADYQKYVVIIANLSTKNVLLAIPFFVVSGALMAEGSISKRLIGLAQALLGWLPGGLAVATVLACGIFAAISGSSPVTVIAIGSVMFPALIKERYADDFSLGLVTSAGSLGILIPPSIPMLVFALVASSYRPVDVGEMFLAGVLPGVVMMIALSIYCVMASRKSEHTRVPFSAAEAWFKFKEAIWALGLPFLILGGIYSGVFTPTEAAAVSVPYALAVELLVHRELKLRDIPRALSESAVAMGALLAIMAMAFALNDFLVLRKVPELAAAAIRAMELHPFGFLLALNVLLLFVGCLMDSISAILILAPLMMPIAVQLGVDPIHLGIIFIVNLEIGYLTPPIGMNLFVASTVFKRPLGMVIRGAVPFIAIMAVVMLAVTYVPTLSLGPVSAILRKGDFYVAFPTGVEAAPVAAPDQEAPKRVLSIEEMMRRAKEKQAADAPTP